MSKGSHSCTCLAAGTDDQVASVRHEIASEPRMAIHCWKSTARPGGLGLLPSSFCSIGSLFRAAVDLFRRPRALGIVVYFGWITEYVPSPDLTVFVKVDWRDLILTSLPIGTKDAEIGLGYAFRVRDKFMRPCTKAETIQSLRTHAAIAAGFLASEQDSPSDPERMAQFREDLERAKAALRQLGEDPEPQPGGIRVTVRPGQ